jgi:hypothetical protein
MTDPKKIMQLLNSEMNDIRRRLVAHGDEAMASVKK